MRFIAGDVILGATTVRQITSSGVGPGAGIMTQYGSTDVDPKAFFSHMFEPVVNFTTEDIVGYLTGVSATAGLLIAASTAVTVPFRKGSSGGTFQSNGNHFTISGNEGALVIPESISARQGGQNITLTSSVHYLSDDGESPLSESAAANYASETANAPYGFGGGSLTYSGPTVITPDMIAWQVNFGITVEKQWEGSGKAPKEIYITSRAPSIDLTFRSNSNLTSLTSGVKDLTAVNVYGRRRTDLGGYVADDQSSHLSLSFGDAIGSLQQVQGSGRGASEVTYRVQGKALTASVTTALA